MTPRSSFARTAGSFPGIRPGRPTADYLARVVTRITIAGALFLGIVATLPTVLGLAIPGLSGIALGGTGLLIVVSVIVETMKQIEAQLLMRNYEGLSDSLGRAMTVVVLLGAPGAGKGTQAPVLARQLDVPVLASGDLLRAAVAAGTKLGREADRYMSRGQLVPDETIVRVFLDRLERPDARRGAILDGFPRTRVQAEALDAALAEAGRRVNAAVFIDVPTEDLIVRMANRRICTANGHVYNLASNPPLRPGLCDVDGSPLSQRPDDEEATVRARMSEQIRPLLEVVDHYRTGGNLVAVDGRAPIEAVSTAVLAAAAAAIASNPSPAAGPAVSR